MLALISLFFNDRSENDYLMIYRTDFSSLSVLGADDRSGPLFPMHGAIAAVNDAAVSAQKR